MHILLFNRSFYPDLESTGQLTTELCNELTKYGYDVDVICGASYLYGKRKNKSLIEKDNYNSVKILRGYGTTLPKKYLFFRLINLGTYYIVAFLSGFHFVKNKPNVVISMTDPPLLGLLGIFFSILYRAKFIYYCQDIYPDVGIVSGKLRNPILNSILTISNLLSYKLANKIIVIGETMKKRLESKGVDKNKIVVIHNWADTKNVFPVKTEENKFVDKYSLDGYFTVMYAGNLGLTQNLDKVIDLANELKVVNDIKFLMVGEGANKATLQKKVEGLNLNNVVFIPFQAKNDLRYCLSSASVHLVPFMKGLAGILVPSKVYNIMACAKPFIGWIDSDSEIADIAKKYNCGLIAEPGNLASLKEAILWAYENRDKLNQIGEDGFKAVKGNFDLEAVVIEFVKIFSVI